MILTRTNNTTLYNAQKTYIDKYITGSQNEEFIRNYSYKQISVLKLYCAFNLAERLYNLSLLTDSTGTLLYTQSELFINYDVLTLAAELQKIDINFDTILKMFFATGITTDLLSYKNQHQSISKLDKLAIVPTVNPEPVVVEDIPSVAQFYEFTTGALVKNVTKTVIHGYALSNYSITARSIDGTNNAATSILMKNVANPTNAIDIKVGLNIPAPGLKIQIIGI